MPLRSLDEISAAIAACWAQIAALRAEKKRVIEAQRSREVHRIVEDYVSDMPVRQVALKWNISPPSLYALMNGIGVQRYHKMVRLLTPKERYAYRVLRGTMTKQEAWTQIISARCPKEPLAHPRRAGTSSL